MLKTLHLKNVILIEQAEIEFSEGLNILTGETGAGKTLILQALDLILGGKADQGLIRAGAEKASVEAAFCIEECRELHSVLDDAGIEHDDELIIRREVRLDKRGRTFINSQMAPIHLLQKVGAHLIEIVDQQAGVSLRSEEMQRNLLDIYGDLLHKRRHFEETYKKRGLAQKELLEIEFKLKNREREADLKRYQLEEIKELNLQENEEATLFSEFQKLSNVSVLSEKLQEMTQLIDQIPYATMHRNLEELLTIDSGLKSIQEMVQSGSIQLQEASLEAERYLDTVDQNPTRYREIDERLAAIHQVTKKYGAELQVYKEGLLRDLKSFEKLDDKKTALEKLLKDLDAEILQLSDELSSLRKKHAMTLSMHMTKELRFLNMPDAEFSIRIEPKELSLSGADLVAFYLMANKGESPASLKEKTSGGETARVLFALKVILAEKEKIPTLIFDEIDANIGGRTASVVAEKLEKLGEKRQIFCITHFPQVACKATQHLRIYKQEIEGRTQTFISILSPEKRKQELLRMLGGEEIISNYSTESKP